MKKNLLHIFFGTLILCVLPSLSLSAQTSPLCDTEIVHLGISAESHSKVALTVTNIDANTVSISIKKIGDLNINSLTVETTIGNVSGSGDASKFEATITSATPPETFTINALLWNGFIIRAENYPELTNIPFAGTCGGSVSYNLNLSTLTINGVAVNDFSPSKGTYNVELPFGTTAAPVVAATAANAAYTPSIEQATSTDGTATITVTALEDPSATKEIKVNFSVSTINPGNNNECSGTTNEVQEGNPYNYSYLFETNEQGVIVTAELLEPKDGVVAYVRHDFNEAGGFQEVGMTLVEGRKFTQTLPYTTDGEKITVAIKFAYAGGLTVTKVFEYTVGKTCGNPTNIIGETTNNFSIYPNPIVNTLNVSTDSNITKISVYNTSGQLVKVVNANSSDVSISVSDLLNGQYVVIINTIDGKEFIKKIIK